MKVNNMKLLPAEARPYEKAERYGLESLTDSELLSIILRNGTKEYNALELSQQILEINENGLLNLYKLTRKELEGNPGIGRVKSLQIKCIGEIAKRIHKQKSAPKMSLSSAKSVAGYYMEELRYAQTERVIISMFDSASHLLGDRLLSVGTVNRSLVSPREVFLNALDAKAVYIILLHNHPGGNLFPSDSDRKVTEILKQCGDMLGIVLADHIIIGDNEYFSFREHRMIV